VSEENNENAGFMGLPTWVWLAVLGVLVFLGVRRARERQRALSVYDG